MALNDNDLLLISDSEDSFESKKIKYSTLKSNIYGDSGNDLQAVTDNGNTTTNGAEFGNGNISLNADGSAEFDGSVAIGGSVGNQTVNGVYLNDAGYVASTGSSGNNIWLGYLNGTAGETSRITADGSASFGSGNIEFDADGASRFARYGFFGARDINSSDAAGVNINGTGSLYFQVKGTQGDGSKVLALVKGKQSGVAGEGERYYLQVEGTTWQAGNSYVGGASSSPACAMYADGKATFGSGNITLNADGSAHFKGNVTSDGTIGFNLEADNPANFNVEGEYTGPTLDVKERVLNLVARLDALEANEVIDDAVDTSLLSLLASASARLDSIEARLSALEGGA